MAEGEKKVEYPKSEYLRIDELLTDKKRNKAATRKAIHGEVEIG